MIINTKHKIAIIICWYGPYPWYFPYFVISCLYNPTIDFYIITDNLEIIINKPSNLIIKYKTLKEINVLFSKQMNFEIDIKHPYKLCDFKPAYGFFFSDIVENYDFWGHSDIDIIFGRIRNFLTDDILQVYDVLSMRHDWLTGCFLLYRNNNKINLLFKKSKDYKKIFRNNKIYCFDETGFAHDEFTSGKKYYEIKTEIESMMHVVKKMEALNYIKFYSDLHIIDGIPGNIKWNNGLLTYKNNFEILLYHLIIFKKKYKIKNQKVSIPSIFNISSSKIYH